MVLSIATAVLFAYIAPAAEGFGILEVKAYLNGIDAHFINNENMYNRCD
jgi:chloride channel 7